MNPFQSIARMRLDAVRNRALNVRKDSVTKVLVVFLGLGTVLGLGYTVSHEVFQFIEGFPAFGAALNAKMVSLLFFTLLILVVFSTIIVAYTTIFLAKETDFFFQHPVPPRTVLAVKLTEAIAFSSWATLFLCFPVLVAYGHLRGAPLTYYLEAGAILTVFLLFAGLTGTSIAMLIAPIVRALSGRQLILVAFAVVTGLGFAFLRSFNFWDMDGQNDLLILDRFMSQLAAVHSPYFPGYWAASAVLAAAGGNHSEVLFQGCTLLANTLVYVPLLGAYGLRFYGKEWLASRGRLGVSRPRGARQGRAPARAHVQGPTRALIQKDLLVFARDPAQLSQSMLFVLLMVIYSLSLLRIPEFTGRVQLLIYFANLTAVCTILSSFTSRFLFPLISLEGRAFWILGLAPVPRGHLVRQKAIFGLTVTGTLGLLTITASNAALHSPPGLFAAATYTVLLAGVCLTSLATGLGAAYPVFDEDNPARIAVGLGGTLNFFASALSVAFIIFLESLPYLTLGEVPPPWAVFGAHAGAFAFAAGLSAFCYRLGARSLLRRDF